MRLNFQRLQSIIVIMLLSGFQMHSITIDSLYSNHAIQQAAEYNTQLGLAYLQAGDMAYAKARLWEAEKQSPKSPIVKSAIAYFLEQINEREQSECYHQAAVKLDPTGGAMHNNFGRFLCNQGRHAEAEAQFLIAIQDKNYLNTAEALENAG